ncbi:hypothetical protein BGX38DRAFT_1272040 [Terfezia claveryi]|nr:hypothetical protein BGX38DRAFT_1272040 [Terfezia claveryi]
MVSLKDIGATLLTWGVVANAYCSEVNVCATAVVPKTNSQDLYLQITAPSDSGWAGVGLGSQMKGATIFVIYPNAAKTNLTLSPRTGKGRFEPEHDSSIDATVLEGTEIKDGKWIMNFVCHNCRDVVDVTSTNADFIYAQGGGDSVSGDQPDASIYQHGTRGQFTMNLVAVTKTTSGNPFDATTNTSGNNTDSSSDDDSNTTGDSGNGGGSSQSMSEADRTLRSHGIIMAVSWLFLLPLGATFIRFLAQAFPRPVPLYMHAGIQLFTFILATVGFGLGISTSAQNETHWTADHQKLGVAIMVLFFLQAPMGYIHHVNYVATGERGFWSHAHIWNGRLVMLLGIVNGGLGLDLAGIKRKSFGVTIGVVDKKWVIAYSVVAGIVGSLYIGGLVGKALMGEARRERGNKKDESY